MLAKQMSISSLFRRKDMDGKKLSVTSIITSGCFALNSGIIREMRDVPHWEAVAIDR